MLDVKGSRRMQFLCFMEKVRKQMFECEGLHLSDRYGSFEASAHNFFLAFFIPFY